MSELTDAAASDCVQPTCMVFAAGGFCDDINDSPKGRHRRYRDCSCAWVAWSSYVCHTQFSHVRFNIAIAHISFYLFQVAILQKVTQSNSVHICCSSHCRKRCIFLAAYVLCVFLACGLKENWTNRSFFRTALHHQSLFSVFLIWTDVPKAPGNGRARDSSYRSTSNVQAQLYHGNVILCSISCIFET